MIKYFGYGSNMDMTALAAKGVRPSASFPARLYGWRLDFSVAHFFRHEGGVGNIVPCDDPEACVQGMLHVCDNAGLAALDKLEGYGVGYDRIEVTLDTPEGPQTGFAYVGLPAYVEPGLLPTRRYLNILVRGAQAAGIDPAYVETLRNHPIHAPALPGPFSPSAERLWQHAEMSRDHTALAGHVFDMRDARPAHIIARDWFGGLEVTLFHLKRSDTSDGSETLQDVIDGRLTPAQRTYLNTYLHAFAEEYSHVGRFDYASLRVDQTLG